MKTPSGTPRRFPQAIYVPWVSDELRVARVARVQTLAHRLALQTGHHITGYAATKSHLPAGWGRQPFVTRRTNVVPVASGISIYFWPTISDLATFPPHRVAHAFVIEAASEDLSGWARHHRAVHFDTKQLLAPTLTPDALALYDRIDWNGNNGWRDHVGKRDALHDLDMLRATGELNPADLAGYLIGRQPADAIRRLQALLMPSPHPTHETAPSR